ncbi:hypothetical protein [Winogradskyella tangerina]|uniref:hypothetical protein n=1 Tax=Winogradskyella tangerina TaxID=2023240 RepID=UPI000DBE5D58|nr:hypothetical protein [Winogradskyella tangerina]
MKHKLLIPFLLLVFGYSYSQGDCSKFRTGKFQNNDKGILKAQIQRNDSIQTEQYGEKEVTLKITWIDDCSYRLKFLDGNEAFWASRPKDMPTYDLIVKIVKINGNTYTQESKFDTDNDFVYISEITKIE